PTPLRTRYVGDGAGVAVRMRPKRGGRRLEHARGRTDAVLSAGDARVLPAHGGVAGAAEALLIHVVAQAHVCQAQPRDADGGATQLGLFDYTPELMRLHDQPCPGSLLEGKRFAFIEGVPNMLGPQATFAQRGESGLSVSNLLPHFHQQVDKVTLLKAMYTDEF